MHRGPNDLIDRRKVPVDADLPDLEEYSGGKEHASQDLHLKQNAFVFIHGEHPFGLGG